MLRMLTAGESHGAALVSLIDGLPAGLAISQVDLERDLRRRQIGYGRGGRMQIEQDSARLLSGVRFGRTLGTPVALLIENRDWPAWQEKMSPLGEVPEDLETMLVPRPGHADLAGYYKLGHSDLRNVLERASARETAARTAAGSLARKLLQNFEIKVFSHVLAIGDVTAKLENLNWPALETQAEASDLRCADPAAEAKMKSAIDQARARGDSLGGLIQIVVLGAPPGLGSYSQWDRRLDGRLAGALMSIPAIKGVEIGAGFAAAGLAGSEVHDSISLDQAGNIRRGSNRAGGLEGGLSNGQPILLQIAMKPIPTLTSPLPSVNLATGEPAPASKERSDVCAVAAAGVVAEAMACWVLADTLLEKFGGDTVAEMKVAWEAYQQRINRRNPDNTVQS
jgi:chorismate synthase